MERRPFTIKEPPFSQRLMRALPFIGAWLVITPLMVITIGPHVPAWTVVLLVFSFFFLLIFLHIRSDMRRVTLPNLLASPCPQCGASPMKFDRSSMGDYAFICDRCQIEWALKEPPSHSQ
jgi:hypothetical protein